MVSEDVGSDLKGQNDRVAWHAVHETARRYGLTPADIRIRVHAGCAENSLPLSLGDAQHDGPAVGTDGRIRRGAQFFEDLYHLLIGQRRRQGEFALQLHDNRSPRRSVVDGQRATGSTDEVLGRVVADLFITRGVLGASCADPWVELFSAPAAVVLISASFS